MSIFIVHDDPVIEQCGYCDNGINGDAYCWKCGGDGVDVFDLSTLATLSHNLSIVAGLCAAWHDGFHSGVLLHSADVFDYWRPGCGKAAP